MVDYRKFDHIEDSDEDEPIEHPAGYGMRRFPVVASSNGQGGGSIPQPVSVPSSSSVQKSQQEEADKHVIPMAKKGKEGRIRYEFNGRLIYEWEQNLNEVLIYITPPPGLNKKMLKIDIANRHLTVGIANSPPYIDEDTGGSVKVSESLWQIDDGEIVINLQKLNKAEAWDCALVGRGGESLDPHTKEEVRKKLMLERFQEEVRPRS